MIFEMGSEESKADGSVKRTNVSNQEWGSDYIADLLKAYDFDYIPFNPGASFRGIEESIVNYNDNEPEIVTTPNEALSVSIAHGYAKATGEPGVCLLHNVVGTMNAAMSIYNAYIDRVPIMLLSGTGPMQKSHRRPWIDWIHTAHLQGNIVRDYVKWDSQPNHIDGVEDSFTRAYEISQTKPKGPTYVTFDHSVQERELDKPVPVPTADEQSLPSKMGADPKAIETAASLLSKSEMPVIVVDQVGDSEDAVESLVDLAETLGAPVVDIRWRRFNFPNTHPLYQFENDVLEEADVVLGLDVWDIGWVTNDLSSDMSELLETAKYIKVGTHELEASGLFPNTYAKRDIDVPILADTETAIPALLASVEEKLDPQARERAEERYATVASLHEEQRERSRTEAEEAWDEDPISTARLVGEVWNVIEDEEWVLVNDIFPDWANELWDVEEFDQYIGGYGGGGGVGYGIGAAIGAALGVSDSDRIPVNLQADGDLMQFLGGLWVIGQQEIPLFTVMHNNRSMHNSTNHRMQLADYRERDDTHEQALVGTGLTGPTPDYASIAEAQGVNGYGPIRDPECLPEALAKAWEDIQNGEPALVDVVCQSR